jgi:glycosyltransferase involved in cell wall biosynthesis
MFALRSFHKVIAVSGPIQKRAANFGLNNISLIHNAIDTNEWKPLYPPPALKILKNIPISPQSFIIGYIGRISREKGPLDFVMVADSLLKRDTQFEFIVAGDGPEIDAMKSLAKTSGILDRFHFLGHVNINEMAAVYQKLDILVSPSLTEGLPNNLLEALAMHVPVVATKVGGVSEVIIDNYNGLLVQPGNIGYMVENILAIKNNPDMANKFRENGRHVVETKFSFEDRVRKIETLYTQLSKTVKN